MGFAAALARAPLRGPLLVRRWPGPGRWKPGPGGVRALATPAGQHHDNAIRNIRNIGIIAHVDAVRLVVFVRMKLLIRCTGEDNNHGSHAI